MIFHGIFQKIFPSILDETLACWELAKPEQSEGQKEGERRAKLVVNVEVNAVEGRVEVTGAL